MKRLELKNWNLIYDDKRLPVQVPGDITMDLYRAGQIEDPYYGMNHLKLEWIAERDFVYETVLEADENLLKEESVRLVFEGIDLFAEIYINGHLLGKTENMFLAYQYEILPYLIHGQNRLKVVMKSTTKAINEGKKPDEYISIFNTKRFFLRKAQCHFGWDWAPDMPGYGIWGKVYMEAGSKYRIRDVHYRADEKGNVTFFAETDYNLLNVYAPGSVVAVAGVNKKGDTLRFSVSKEPFGKPVWTKECSLEGSKCFVNFKYDDPQFWWPAGYGKQPLYLYRIELVRDGKVCDSKCGRFALRTVKVLENPCGDRQLTHTLYVNDTKIFMKGSNWVPMDCFTGTITRERYEHFIDRAVEGNYNMLRVWGGGIYETEDFFELCDEKGIMVWHDIALACSDVPEEEAEWVNNFLKEVEYQVRRLRVHPSLVYWSGGNERPGSFAMETSKGDFLVNYTLPGFVNFYDNTRPYYRQSPCSYTDIGNDPSNGDCHWGNFERCLTDGVADYRSYISEKIAPLASECAIMGPCSEESFRKFMPEDKLWPMNEVWKDRLTDNPGSFVKMDFAEREFFYAEQFYGTPKNLTDFIAKGMQVHAEAIRAELEIMRAHKELCSGFMNWMYNDIWPQATWSVVDYYGEPKQAYYQMKRSFEPVLVTFFQHQDGNTQLAVVNDRMIPYSDTVRYHVKDFAGNVLFENECEVKELVNASMTETVSFNCDRDDVYLTASYMADGEMRKTLYSPHFWRNVEFASDYEVESEQISDVQVRVKIHAKKFAKSVFISHKDNFKFTYSDNYVDIEAGDTVEIMVSGKEKFSKEDLKISDFALLTK